METKLKVQKHLKTRSILELQNNENEKWIPTSYISNA